jgi:hypothetical protein
MERSTVPSIVVGTETKDTCVPIMKREEISLIRIPVKTGEMRFFC